MGTTDFYGAYVMVLQEAAEDILAQAQQMKEQRRCIEHITSRIKCPFSAQAKLEKRGLMPTLAQAKESLTDLVGVRLVCRFVSDIYTVSDLLSQVYEVVEVKDYIASPKPNGYRSYHMILKVPTNCGELVAAEIQLRTISQDAWACLEHQIKYKKDIRNEAIVRHELKRCAEDLAATDLCMQTIREFIELEDNSEPM